VMISPLPRNKRAKNPHQVEGAPAPAVAANNHPAPAAKPPQKNAATAQVASKAAPSAFANSPFAKIDVNASERS